MSKLKKIGTVTLGVIAVAGYYALCYKGGYVIGKAIANMIAGGEGATNEA